MRAAATCWIAGSLAEPAPERREAPNRLPAALPRMAVRGRAFFSEQTDLIRIRDYKGGAPGPSGGPGASRTRGDAAPRSALWMPPEGALGERGGEGYGYSRSYSQGIYSADRFCEKGLCPFARRKSSNFTIVRIVARCFRRPKNNELPLALFDNFGQVIALAGSHMQRTAMRTVVIASAGPFVGPFITAASALIVVAEPGHMENQRLFAGM
jgi:hypothetical protein